MSRKLIDKYISSRSCITTTISPQIWWLIMLKVVIGLFNRYYSSFFIFFLLYVVYL